MRFRKVIGLGALVAVPALLVPRVGTGTGPKCKDAELRVRKGDGIVELWCGGQERRSFAATFGANPSGPKEREGDERTPEGRYRITSRLKTPRFHRFLGVSYPNDDDRRRA